MNNTRSAFGDSMVKSAVLLIKKRPGWILKRVASELNLNYGWLQREFMKRGVKISEVKARRKMQVIRNRSK